MLRATWINSNSLWTYTGPWIFFGVALTYTASWFRSNFNITYLQLLNGDDMCRTWNNAQHISKGSMDVNYYCHLTPPSLSPGLHNELSSLIKFIT